jgi:hypothetical protein
MKTYIKNYLRTGCIAFAMLVCALPIHTNDKKESIDLKIAPAIELSLESGKIFKGTVKNIDLGFIQAGSGSVSYDASKNEVTLTFDKAQIFDKTFKLELKTTKKAEKISGSIATAEGSGDPEVLGIELAKTSIDIKTKSKEVTLSGTFDFLDLSLKGEFSGSTKEKSASFKAEIEVAKEFKPFKNSDVDNIKDITIKKISAGISGGLKKEKNKIKNAQKAAKSKVGLKGSLFIEGEAEILNIGVKARIEASFKGKDVGISAIAQTTESATIPKMFPENFKDKDGKETMLGQKLGAIALSKASIVVTTQKEFTHEKTTYKRGLNVQAGIALKKNNDNEVIQFIERIFNETDEKTPAEITLSGNIQPKVPPVFELKAGIELKGINFSYPSKDDLKSGEKPNIAFKAPRVQMKLSASGAGQITFGIGGGFDLEFKSSEKPILFDAEIMLRATDFGASFSMQNHWDDAFGLKGFSFGNLGVQATQTYSAFVSGPATLGITALLPATLGFTGEATLNPGKKFKTIKTKFAVNIGKDVREFALEAKIDNIPSMSALLKIIMMQIKEDVSESKLDDVIDKVIPLEISNIHLKIAPFGSSIGKIDIDQGMKAAFKGKLFGEDIGLDMGASFDKLKIHVKGEFPRIELPGLKITGAGGKGKPLIDSEISLERQAICASGEVLIADGLIKSSTHIDMSKAGVFFRFDNRVGPFMACIKGETKVKKEKIDDFKLTIDFKQNLFEELNKLTESLAEVGKTQLEIEGKDKIENKVNLDKIDPNFLQERLKVFRKKQKAIDKAYAAKTKEAKEELDEAEKKLQEAEKAQSAINAAYAPIEDPEEEFEKWKEEKKERKKKYDRIQESYNIEKSDLFKDVFKKIFEAGKEVLVFTMKAVTGILQKGINIERVLFEGSTKDLVQKGKAPEVTIAGKILGSKRCSKFQFNFKKPERSVKEIGTGIIHLIAGGDKTKDCLDNLPPFSCDDDNFDFSCKG